MSTSSNPQHRSGEDKEQGNSARSVRLQFREWDTLIRKIERMQRDQAGLRADYRTTLDLVREVRRSQRLVLTAAVVASICALLSLSLVLVLRSQLVEFSELLSTLPPAPILQEPPNSAEFCEGEEFTLQWQWDGIFEPNEYYAVRIWKDESGSYAQSRHWEADPSRQSFRVQLEERDVPEEEQYYQGTGPYLWNVVVLFYEGQADDQDNKIWETRSEESETRRFVVLPVTDPKCVLP